MPHTLSVRGELTLILGLVKETRNMLTRAKHTKIDAEAVSLAVQVRLDLIERRALSALADLDYVGAENEKRREGRTGENQDREESR